MRGGDIDGKPPQQDVIDVGGHRQVGRGMPAAVAHDGSPFAAVDTICVVTTRLVRAGPREYVPVDPPGW